VKPGKCTVLSQIELSMRIAMLTYQCSMGGGSYLRSWSLAQALCQRGHLVTLFASRRSCGLKPRQYLHGPVKVLEMPSLAPRRLRNGGFSIIDTIARCRRLRMETYDIVHAFEHRPAGAYPAWLQKRAPFISDWADLWGPGGLAEIRPGWERPMAFFDRKSEKWLHRKAVAITAISHHLIEISENLGYDREHLLHLGVGANYRDIVPLARGIAREKLQIAPGRPVLVNIGFASNDKVFTQAAIIHLQRLVPEVLVLCCGGSADALARHFPPTVVRSFGILPYEELPTILSAADLAMLPMAASILNQARLPNRFGDYLAAGRAVACSEVGDLPDIIREERIGIVTPANPEAFAAGIASLLADKARCLEYGLRARSLAEGRFSWSALAEKLETFYYRFTGRQTD
jgi:glycosyltransferase involved in cell wall biosynthesis